ncbi:hypothetical protein [Paenibacillus larvae]|uniref:hypothetical protein n=1 Tax=Paenibacillus larvae TaxID=1464 RepID=UPI002891D43B|nr:hypothetical protein [Paenibacillus larvae]MDT2192061.1 hypothetical protein [Paenibacillus larvae]
MWPVMLCHRKTVRWVHTAKTLDEKAVKNEGFGPSNVVDGRGVISIVVSSTDGHLKWYLVEKDHSI